VAYCAIGGIVLFSGVKGATISDTLSAALKGNLSVSDTETITTTADASGTAGAADVAAPVNDPSFAKSVLSGIGAPQTQANIASIESWIGREGGGGQNNPLNTTYPLGGSTALAGNPDGVQNYPTIQDGVSATVSTLENGNYPDILMLLQSGQGLCGQQLQGLATWSGGVANGGYSSVC
jgi:hypothetical protein